jgi:N utilization substance protein B
MDSWSLTLPPGWMMAVIPALTAEAARRIEAARGKFNPTEEDLHPRMRFAENGVSALLQEDPDFQRLTEKKKISWANNDALLNNLYETLKTRPWFQAYLDGKEASLQADIRLWQQFFQEELEDNEELLAILEDSSIFWADELPYVLGTCIRSLEEMGRTGRWSYPPLYQSDILAAQGKPAESDRDFVHKLVTASYGRYAEYSALVAGSVSKWDQDRLYTTDTVLIVMGLTEAETFPEIPVKVSINEYVEISKYYSTPKSRGFVNGLLDRLIKEKGLL